MRRILLALPLVLALAATAGLWAAGPAQATANGSPHAIPDGCPACHDPGAEPGSVGSPRPAIATCRGCHPTADMHSVGVLPVDTGIPHGWPLEQAAVTCATCHAEPACDSRRPTEAPFLRGGPYQRPAQLCSRCHDTAALKRTSPHPPSDPDAPPCAACHTGAPPEHAAPADARLRGPAAAICQDCHPTQVHAGVADHVGAPLDAGIASELAGRLPLAPDGTIACWTCHEVHEEPTGGPGRSGGASDSRRRRHADRLRGLARGPRPPGVGDAALLALPVSDGALCRACHGTGP
jgi:hypothetical protein